VIVRVRGPLSAERQALNFGDTVGDHHVDVHGELRAAAAHPDILGGEAPLRAIGLGGRPFHDRESCDHLVRHEIAADTEVVDRPLRLGTPELALGDFDRAEAVGLRAAV
jgi:hypothetical protein